ncbi:integral membrane protein [Paenibacillus polymyxa]|uniref:Fluoride-specific ion channel FluC n=2 Tax=Paenibacillus TaxID=44249 RepID=A0A378Y4V6_PAEPO|nr:integral membrane protein [Paenibacillus polymyxa]
MSLKLGKTSVGGSRSLDICDFNIRSVYDIVRLHDDLARAKKGIKEMKDVLFVAAGGALGTSARYSIQLLLPAAGADFPFGVLLMNWLGCLFLGWFFTVTLRSWRINPRWRLAIGTGFTGGFTTFSTFTVDAVRLTVHDRMLTAILYLLLSVGGGLFLTWAGIRLGTKMTQVAPKEEHL